MGDECDKQFSLGEFIFDEENHERKLWKYFGRTCNRSLLIFMCQLLVIVLILACEIARKLLSTTCEKSRGWVAVLSSTVDYNLLSPDYEKNNFYLRLSFYFASWTEWIWKIASHF